MAADVWEKDVWEFQAKSGRFLPPFPSFPRENRNSRNVWENAWKSQTSFFQTSAVFSPPAFSVMGSESFLIPIPPFPDFEDFDPVGGGRVCNARSQIRTYEETAKTLGFSRFTSMGKEIGEKPKGSLLKGKILADMTTK